MSETMYFVTETDDSGRPRGIVTTHDMGEGVVEIRVNGRLYMTLDDGLGKQPLTAEADRIPGIAYEPQQGAGHAAIVKLDE